MNNKEKVIVKKGIQRQYFPNQEGNFNYKNLKKRVTGIKDIEKTYIERVKHGMDQSPADNMKIREIREYQTAIKSLNAFKKDAFSPRKLNIKRTILTSQKEIDKEFSVKKGTIGDPLKSVSAVSSTKGKSAHKLTKNNQSLAAAVKD